MVEIPFLVRFRGGKNSKILNLGTIKRVHFNFLEFEFGCFFLNSHLRILATGSRQNNKSCIIFSRKKNSFVSFQPCLEIFIKFCGFSVSRYFVPTAIFVCLFCRGPISWTEFEDFWPKKASEKTTTNFLIISRVLLF